MRNHINKHLIWTTATNEFKFFEYLVANPRHLLICKNAFSTRWRSLYSSISQLRWAILFLLGGMTTVVPILRANSIISFTSYALSASRHFALKPSINSQAWVQSAVVPSVTINLTGIPCASTAKCILVLSPLLCDSSLGCRPLHLMRADALWHALHLSSAIQNQAHQSFALKAVPTRLCLANGRIYGGCFSSRRNQAANPAMAHLFAISTALHL